MLVTRSLTADEFRNCFAEPMTNVTAEARPVVDIWPYVDALDLGELQLPSLGDVHYVYRDANSRFDQVLIGTGRFNALLAVVVNLSSHEILGHHVLDLDKLFGDAGGGPTRRSGPALMFFYIEPEVAGGLGPRSVVERKDGELIVGHLNYEFEGWLGDALLEATPCFIVTDAARRLIEKAGLSGVSFTEVEISRSETFVELHPSRELPDFWRMAIRGEALSDDFSLAADRRLMVSAAALATLRAAGIENALVEPA